MKVDRLIKAYRPMPDEYATPCVVPPTTEDFGTQSCLTSLGVSFKRPARLWEWCAGSGRLSATARTEQRNSSKRVVLHPLDYRWGHNLEEPSVQSCLMWCLIHFGTLCLFVAPTCTPWSNNSRVWAPHVLRGRRDEEGFTLQFVALACLVQAVLGRGFMIENPAGRSQVHWK